MSEILDIANEMARDLFKVGAMDEITMRKIDALCLPPQRPYQPEDIRRIRKANHVSHWEQGKKNPSGPAQRLLDLIDRKGLSALG
jgi:putative transcriptional regulator